ncbi:LOW QUALITY PROTEIN: hypothetical protein V1477_012184 [Vespula maculifrons]|uniref:Uncharacterized protein n=1 Tax=Vespula maculifrons TaxID=7453 RepID=A0ABD2BWS7_VESMC
MLLTIFLHNEFTVDTQANVDYVNINYDLKDLLDAIELISMKIKYEPTYIKSKFYSALKRYKSAHKTSRLFRRIIVINDSVYISASDFYHIITTDFYVCCHPVKVFLCIISVLSVINIFVICTTLCTLLNEGRKNHDTSFIKNCGNKRNTGQKW